MSRHLITLAAAAGLTVAIGLVSGGEWPHFVFGVVYALVLWMMLFFGTSAKEGALTRAVPWQTYAIAAVLVVGLGFVFYSMGSDNGAWWAPAVIMVGVFMPMVPLPPAASGSAASGE